MEPDAGLCRAGGDLPVAVFGTHIPGGHGKGALGGAVAVDDAQAVEAFEEPRDRAAAKLLAAEQDQLQIRHQRAVEAAVEQEVGLVVGQVGL